MITVVNQKAFAGQGVYIGRKRQDLAASPLANNFKLGKDGDRDQVIAKYRSWLWREIQAHGPAVDELLRLAELDQAGQDVYLVCWCAPLPCHGDVVKGAIQWLNRT